MVEPRAGSPVSLARRQGHLARDGRARLGQDKARRGMDLRAGQGLFAVLGRHVPSYRAGRRDAGRRARGDDRGPVGHPRRCRRRPTALRAEPAQAGLRQRRGGADVFLRGPGEPARAAIRRRMVRRAGEMAASAGDVRHAAVRPAAGQEAAPAHHHDAAADPADQAAGGRARRDSDGHAHRGQWREPRRRVPGGGECPLCGLAARTAGTRRRADRRPRGRAVAARGTGALRGNALGSARTDRCGGRPAGQFGAEIGRLRDRGGGARRERPRGRAGGCDAGRGRTRQMGARGPRALQPPRRRLHRRRGEPGPRARISRRPPARCWSSNPGG